MAQTSRKGAWKYFLKLNIQRLLESAISHQEFLLEGHYVRRHSRDGAQHGSWWRKDWSQREGGKQTVAGSPRGHQEPFSHATDGSIASHCANSSICKWEWGDAESGAGYCTIFLGSDRMFTQKGLKKATGQMWMQAVVG